MNENLIAILVVLATVVVTYLGLDNGDLLKLVITTYLGFLGGKRYESSKRNKR